nr:venom gland protein U2-PHTX-Pmx1c [Physocyclus mexicanus]
MRSIFLAFFLVSAMAEQSYNSDNAAGKPEREIYLPAVNAPEDEIPEGEFEQEILLPEPDKIKDGENNENEKEILLPALRSTSDDVKKSKPKMEYDELPKNPQKLDESYEPHKEILLPSKTNEGEEDVDYSSRACAEANEECSKDSPCCGTSCVCSRRGDIPICDCNNK